MSGRPGSVPGFDEYDVAGLRLSCHTLGCLYVMQGTNGRSLAAILM